MRNKRESIKYLYNRDAEPGKTLVKIEEPPNTRIIRTPDGKLKEHYDNEGDLDQA